MQVRKRDGRVVDFDRSRIGNAIRKAFLDVKPSVHPEILGELTTMVEERLPVVAIIDIENIQDVVEQVLMESSHFEVAKAFILWRQERFERRKLEPDPNAIADYIHAAKYAQYLPEKIRRETFHETIDRVEAMHIKKYPKLQTEIRDAFRFVHDKRVLPSMRSMQFGGRAIEKRNARLYNCSFTLIDRPRVFSEIMYLLLCGCGVGYSVQTPHVDRLPKMKEIDTKLTLFHSVEDSIEGWADAVDALMNSFLRGYNIEFNFDGIRPPGSVLNSGGKAPGHVSLKESLEEMRKILLGSQGRQLRTVECHDIICHLSKAVLAGGIRRSSLIAIFSMSDEDMLYCKDKSNFDFQFKNTQRALANNSVAIRRDSNDFPQFLRLKHINKTNFGDPGFVFLDDFNTGVNPCGEILIDPVLANHVDSWSEPGPYTKKSGAWAESSDEEKEGATYYQTGFGFCNLVEVNVAKCENEQDFYEACAMASFIATLQSGYTNFPYLGNVTEQIVRRDALIGVSLTGMMDNSWIFEQDKFLEKGARIVKKTNEEVALKIEINPARRCTCIKPSGTASLELGGVSSGIHPHHSKRYFRRVIANPLEPVAQYFKKHNSHMVETMPNGDWCITFPMKTNGITLDDITAKDFLDRVFHTYCHWIRIDDSQRLTHNISCTLAVTSEEWDWAFQHVWENKDKVGSLTFLPKTSDKEIPFCPREAVTTKKDVAEYESLVDNYVPVDYSAMQEDEDLTVKDSACSGDACVIDTSFCSGEGLRVFEGKFSDRNDTYTDDPNSDSNNNFFYHSGLMFELFKQEEGWYIVRRVNDQK
jgi:ribonucleoside-diphosphate reductase alpha chain